MMLKRMLKRRNTGYNPRCDEEVYADAFDRGHEAGLAEGYANGHYKGRKKGYADGRAAGYKEGYDKGYSDGQAASHADRQSPTDEEPLKLSDPITDTAVQTRCGYEAQVTHLTPDGNLAGYVRKPDCPWKYTVWSRAGRILPHGDTDWDLIPKNQYTTIPLKDAPVSSLFKDIEGNVGFCVVLHDLVREPHTQKFAVWLKTGHKNSGIFVNTMAEVGDRGVMLLNGPVTLTLHQKEKEEG